MQYSSAGKAILAFLPDEAVSRMLSRKLAKFTSKTITSKQKLTSQLEQIRQDGFAVDDEEHLCWHQMYRLTRI